MSSWGLATVSPSKDMQPPKLLSPSSDHSLMQIPFIDSSHYRLTPAQAKKLSYNGQLPRLGMDSRAVIPEDLEVVYSNRTDKVTAEEYEVDRAWVSRTRILDHDDLQMKEVYCLILHMDPLAAIAAYARSPQGREEATKRRCWHATPYWIQQSHPHLNPDYIPIPDAP